MRATTQLALTALAMMIPIALSSGPVAAFPSSPIRVCDDPAVQGVLGMCPDDSGGVIVLTTLELKSHLDRIDAAGNSRWGCAEANALTSADGVDCMIPDGSGGLFLCWSSQLPDQFRYAQHFDRDGNSLWGTGVLLGSHPGIVMRAGGGVPDGSGGLYVLHSRWDATFSTERLVLDHIGAAGSPVWPLGSVEVSAAPGNQYPVSAATDGAGGLVLTWSAGNSTAVRLQRFDASGTALWGSGGMLSPSAGAAILIVSDGAQGIIGVWNPTGTSTLLAQRWNSAGAPQWNPNGVPLAFGTTGNSLMGWVADGRGGAIAAWIEGATTVRTQRIDALGQTRWAPNGATLSTATNQKSMGHASPDGRGGASFAWAELEGGNYELHGQQIDSLGAVRVSGGVPLTSTSANETFGWTASDGAGGAYVAWSDAWAGPGDVWLAHLPAASPTTAVAPGVGHGLQLSAPRPNPTSVPFHVSLSLAEGRGGSLELWDVSGRLVDDVALAPQGGGLHEFVWQPRRELAPGAYWLRVRQSGAEPVQRLVIVR